MDRNTATEDQSTWKVISCLLGKAVGQLPWFARYRGKEALGMSGRW